MPPWSRPSTVTPSIVTSASPLTVTTAYLVGRRELESEALDNQRRRIRCLDDGLAAPGAVNSDVLAVDRHLLAIGPRRDLDRVTVPRCVDRSLNCGVRCHQVRRSEVATEFSPLAREFFARPCLGRGTKERYGWLFFMSGPDAAAASGMAPGSPTGMMARQGLPAPELRRAPRMGERRPTDPTEIVAGSATMAGRDQHRRRFLELSDRPGTNPRVVR